MSDQSYSWILFDADNTLLDFDSSERQALQQTLEENGLPCDDEILALYNQINKACWHAFESGQISRQQLRTLRFEQFFGAINATADIPVFSQRYLYHLSQSAYVIEGAGHLLAQLHIHFQMALITNGLRDVQRSRLELSGIQHYFQEVIISDEAGFSKPHTGFFDFTFDKIGSPPRKEVIVVGDSLNADIGGGNAYGLHTCWYNPEKSENQSGISPTFEIHDLAELRNLLLTN
ncbi:MAG: noncanonical pyrimidine nucleotidase, YjjG family [Saprospiraceae bacterium]|jgi:YjjG family noncanonical pyrimidine nucleotidase|nr:noncanonical pyrimidine nucleotidase, YjjG family [Saprospiraceae bacterium]